MIKTRLDITPEIFNVIEEHIKNEIEKEFNDAIEKINVRKDEIVAGTLLNVMQKMDIETNSQRIIFTIKKEN